MILLQNLIKTLTKESITLFNKNKKIKINIELDAIKQEKT